MKAWFKAMASVVGLLMACEFYVHADRSDDVLWRLAALVVIALLGGHIVNTLERGYARGDK